MYPGNNTAALVVFAKTGVIPEYKRAGSVIKLPPPAKEFKPPAKNAALQTQNKLRNSNFAFYRPSTTTRCLSDDLEEYSNAIL